MQLTEDYCPLDWCRLTLDSPWSFRMSLKENKIAFMFKDKSDAMLFKLTWGGE